MDTCARGSLRPDRKGAGKGYSVARHARAVGIPCHRPTRPRVLGQGAANDLSNVAGLGNRPRIGPAAINDPIPHSVVPAGVGHPAGGESIASIVSGDVVLQAC